MRRILIAAAAVAAATALPSTASAVAPPGTCDLIKNTICHYIPPSGVPSGCELQEMIGVVNVRECEDPVSR